MLEGACHCGAVTLRLARAPESLTACNCSICRRLGTVWGYYVSNDVTIDGPTQTYSWGRGRLLFHHCPTCGCTTHWSLADAGRRGRLGVNFRLMEPGDIAGVRVRPFDGAATGKYLDEV